MAALYDVRSNCVVFAVRLYLRRRRKKRGGYISWRASRHGPWPHCVFVSEDRRHWVHYVPRRPLSFAKLTGWRRVLQVFPVHLLLFEGHTKWGD